MPRHIHKMPAAPGDIPISSEDFLRSAFDSQTIAAASASYNTLTNYAAFACDHDGAILCTSRPFNLSPIVLIKRLAWPGQGTYAHLSRGIETNRYTTTYSGNSTSNVTTKIDYGINGGDEAWHQKMRTEAVHLGSNNYDYIPRIFRKKTLTQEQLAALPENSPRADNGRYTRTLNSDSFEASDDYAYIYRIEDNCAHLLSFPLFGISRLRLTFNHQTRFSTDLPLPSPVNLPLQACFAPVIGDKRLIDWPEAPDSINFDATEADYLNGGLLSQYTCDLPQTLQKKGTGEVVTTHWDIDIPPSGLGLLWYQIDPYRYAAYALQMMHANESGFITFASSVSTTITLAAVTALPKT